ncbi:MAG: hypothetical protein H0U27_09100 [Nitrosopumilus sp.]|nr:hypothetical protein [Nitrosopumilus sp.]
MGLLIAGSAFAAMVFLSSNGYFRHVSISFPGETQATVAFENVDGRLMVVGLKGNLGVNPVLIARTDSTYVLTIKNQDSIGHQFYIKGLNPDTNLLNPNESGIITVKETGVGTYRYCDIESEKRACIGTFRVVHVGGV